VGEARLCPLIAEVKKEAHKKQMNTWEKVASVSFALLLIVTIAVTGTLAYENLSAEDWAKQTTETVAVQLVQQRRAYDANGKLTGLEEIENPPDVLVPLVQSAQYDGTNFDQYGMPTAEGYVDQIVRVKNEGTADAYVRVIVAVPAALDDKNDAGHNALHWNLGNRFMADGSFSAENETNEAFNAITWEFSETAMVEGVLCNLYIFTYADPLPGGKTTDAAAFVGFYLDENVDIVNGHILLDGIDTGFTDDTVAIYIKAQAVQAYAMGERARGAFAAAGMNGNPWEE